MKIKSFLQYIVNMFVTIKSKIIKYKRQITRTFIAYTILMFFYSAFGPWLGGGFAWNCYEPGCVINNEELMWNPSDKTLLPGVYGDTCELKLTRRYIIGKVCEPNEWMKEHEPGYNPTGYFIIDKFNRHKKEGMDLEEFRKECQRLDLGACSLNNKSPFFLLFNPFYWPIIFLNAIGLYK